MVAITHRINYLFFVGNDPDGNLGLQSEFPGRCPGLRYLTPSGSGSELGQEGFAKLQARVIPYRDTGSPITVTENKWRSQQYTFLKCKGFANPQPNKLSILLNPLML